jgi:hypothetical protein
MSSRAKVAVSMAALGFLLDTSVASASVPRSWWWPTKTALAVLEYHGPFPTRNVRGAGCKGIGPYAYINKTYRWARFKCTIYWESGLTPPTTPGGMPGPSSYARYYGILRVTGPHWWNWIWTQTGQGPGP